MFDSRECSIIENVGLKRSHTMYVGFTLDINVRATPENRPSIMLKKSNIICSISNMSKNVHMVDVEVNLSLTVEISY